MVQCLGTIGTALTSSFVAELCQEPFNLSSGSFTFVPSLRRLVQRFLQFPGHSRLASFVRVCWDTLVRCWQRYPLSRHVHACARLAVHSVWSNLAAGSRHLCSRHNRSSSDNSNDPTNGNANCDGSNKDPNTWRATWPSSSDICHNCPKLSDVPQDHSVVCATLFKVYPSWFSPMCDHLPQDYLYLLDIQGHLAIS